MARVQSIKKKKVGGLPGFGLSLGFTMFYISILVILPLSMIFINSVTVEWSKIWETISDPRVVASYKLSFGAAFFAAFINVIFGILIAWVLVRYRFPGRR